MSVFKRWWGSIRWRLALGSMLLVLLATGSLALAALLAIAHFYGIDQQDRLTSIASSEARIIGESYSSTNTLRVAVASGLSKVELRTVATNGLLNKDYLMFVFEPTGKPVLPTARTLKTGTVSLAFLRYFVNTSAYPSAKYPDLAKLRESFTLALDGNPTVGEVGNGQPRLVSRPFIAQPIRAQGQDGAPVVGVLIVLPTSTADNTIPPFLASVGQAVLIASLIVVLVAMGMAFVFSRTITRPLAELTRAAHVLGAGDYSVQVPTHAHGELGELATTFNDMAAQLNRDVEMLRQQELWRRELIMSITHDLATPLTAIAGLGDSLLDGVNQSREDYETTGRTIVRETLRLRRLVKDLHVMAKMEAGALQPKRQSVRLAALVDEVLAVLAPEFERAEVEPRNMIAFDLPLVQADADMLTRVFSNLCDNALRHTPTGGVVSIEAQQVGHELQVAVTDTGEGIPTEALPRIFERFYRADNARHSATGGSGLGLAIVRAIVEAHGGKVWAENAQGAGARVVFTLPTP